MKKIFLILFIGLASCSQETNEILYKVESSASTNIQIENLSDQDSVKVYLTIQSPNSVIGMFGITDTTGSKSQGYFFAKKNSSYFLNSSKSLYGFNISFEAPPMSCSQAISNGFLKGINIIEGSINCDYETFDISCVDGVNCIIKTSVTVTFYKHSGIIKLVGNLRKFLV